MTNDKQREKGENNKLFPQKEIKAEKKKCSNEVVKKKLQVG